MKTFYSILCLSTIMVLNSCNTAQPQPNPIDAKGASVQVVEAPAAAPQLYSTRGLHSKKN
ncbi:MAG: hypothetical protein J6J97_06490 [Akkermansia sp.]|nr:hypothetical protein [Akkermansia sp.]MBQ2868756.1 hypothetical protein [Akkermansia sp.]MBQ8377422.1 hypothetical protein [Akkermansia sp.]